MTAFGSVGSEAVSTADRRDGSYEESVPSVVIAKTTLTIAQARSSCSSRSPGPLAIDSRVLGAMLWLLVVEVARSPASGSRCGASLPAGRCSVVRRAEAGRFRAAARRRPARLLPAGLAAARSTGFTSPAGCSAPPRRISSSSPRDSRRPRDATVIEALGRGVVRLVPGARESQGVRSANAAAFDAIGLGPVPTRVQLRAARAGRVDRHRPAVLVSMGWLAKRAS